MKARKLSIIVAIIAALSIGSAYAGPKTLFDKYEIIRKSMKTNKCDTTDRTCSWEIERIERCKGGEGSCTGKTSTEDEAGECEKKPIMTAGLKWDATLLNCVSASSSFSCQTGDDWKCTYTGT